MAMQKLLRAAFLAGKFLDWVGIGCVRLTSGRKYLEYQLSVLVTFPSFISSSPLLLLLLSFLCNSSS